VSFNNHEKKGDILGKQRMGGEKNGVFKRREASMGKNKKKRSISVPGHLRSGKAGGRDRLSRLAGRRSILWGDEGNYLQRDFSSCGKKKCWEVGRKVHMSVLLRTDAQRN